MKIVVLMGSPNRNGSTGLLVSEFCRGAEERRHVCEVIDVCHADIHPCTGYGCGSPSMTKRSRYLREAYELGRSL